MTSPVTMPAKIIIQDLCRLKLGWDEEVPPEHGSKWNIWLKELSELDTFKVPRCIKPPNFGNIVSSQLHHFSDASQSAYGTVSYLRHVNEIGKIHCKFLFSKARLSPLKQISIPRLELAAAALSVRVNKILKSELDITVDDVKYWTDSMTVLRYITAKTPNDFTHLLLTVLPTLEMIPVQANGIMLIANPILQTTFQEGCPSNRFCPVYVGYRGWISSTDLNVNGLVKGKRLGW